MATMSIDYDLAGDVELVLTTKDIKANGNHAT